MGISTCTEPESGLAVTLGADDVMRGDFVAVLNRISEHPSFLWNSDARLLPPSEPVRILWRGADQGRPMKVRAVCLPFVFVQSIDGKYETLDMRQCQLVKLSRGYARVVWKALRKQGR